MQNSPDGKAWSVCHGGYLRPDGSPLPGTLAELLERGASRDADAGILYLSSGVPEEFQTYADLVNEARVTLAGLRDEGLRPGDKLLLQFDRPADFLPAFCACILGGFVPVPFSVPAGYDLLIHSVRLMERAWRRLGCPAFFTSARLAEPLKPFVAREFGRESRVLELEGLRNGVSDDSIYRSQPDDLAVLSLTSGSTGDPKIVALTHDNIIRNIAGSAQTAELWRNDISLNWLRLEHVAVLIRCCLRDIHVGNRQIQAPLEAFHADPLVLLDWLHKYRVTFTALPNFALALINQHLEKSGAGRTWDLSSVRSIISVAEPIVPSTARTFHHHLRKHGLTDSQIHSGWGMSETAGTVIFSKTYLKSLSGENAYADVGVPMPQFSVRIVDAEDRLVREGEIGHVQGKGPDGFPRILWESGTEQRSLCRGRVAANRRPGISQEWPPDDYRASQRRDHHQRQKPLLPGNRGGRGGA